MSEEIFSRPECVHTMCSQPEICKADLYCHFKAVKLPCDPGNRFAFKKIEWKGAPEETAPAPAGTWYFFGDDRPYLVCPECHHRARLGTHTISDDGTINPSIVCPMASCGDGVPRCTAHYYGRLEDWRKP